MANLPNKPFVFNYNARDYNPATYTIPKTSGQTLDMDMVWSATTTTVRNQIAFDEDHISVPMSAYSPFIFSTVANNPLNMGSGNNSMTIIAKVKKTNTSTTTPTDGQNIIANRMSGKWNWMARTRSDGYLSFSYSGTTDQPENMAPYSTGSVVTVAYKIDNETLSIWNLTTNVKSTPISTVYNAGVDRFCFFASLHSGSTSIAIEMMSGDFYWCYASREVLTDEEIAQVVKYNDGGGIDITPDHADFTFTGGTASTVVESETPWSGATTNPWISFTPTTGASGTTTVAITASKNDFNSRSGKITFTDAEENTGEFNITQGGIDGLVPNKKLYKGDRRLN